MQFNPFIHLIGPKAHPFSHIVHVAFTKRIRDTFALFFGGMDFYGHGCTAQRQVDIKLGLIDFVFPVFLLKSAWEYSSGLPIIKVVLAIPYFTLTAVKFIAAAALTLLVFPAILSVHLYNMKKSNQYEESVMKLKVMLLNPVNKREVTGESTIEDLLKKTREVTIEPFRDGFEKYIESLFEPVPKLAVLRTETEEKTKQSYLYITQQLANGVNGFPSAKIAIIADNFKGLSAICKGNFFGVEGCIVKGDDPSQSVNEQVASLKAKTSI